MRWDTCHADGCDRGILPGSDRNMCPWCRGVFVDDPAPTEPEEKR